MTEANLHVTVTARQLAEHVPGVTKPSDGPFGLTIAYFPADDPHGGPVQVIHLPREYRSRKKARKVCREVQKALRS